MKVKTINKVLGQEVDKWIASIKDEGLRKLVKKNVIITGGSIASMLLAEPVNDYDVYIADAKCLAALTAYYVNEFNCDESCTHKAFVILHDHSGNTTFYGDELSGGSLSMVEQEVEEGYRVEIGVEDNVGSAQTTPETEEDKGKYRPVFLSSNAITLSDKFQIIVRFYGDIEEIHVNFDFVHAMNYWTFDDGVVTNTRSLECLLARELIYSGSRYPLASIFRTRKFIIRQWKCPISNYIKMAIQLNEFDLSDIDVLREQLTGVDALYCSQLIAAMSAKQEQDPSFEFGSDYVCALVEKIMEQGSTDDDAND